MPADAAVFYLGSYSATARRSPQCKRSSAAQLPRGAHPAQRIGGPPGGCKGTGRSYLAQGACFGLRRPRPRAAGRLQKWRLLLFPSLAQVGHPAHGACGGGGVADHPPPPQRDGAAPARHFSIRCLRARRASAAPPGQPAPHLRLSSASPPPLVHAPAAAATTSASCSTPAPPPPQHHRPLLHCPLLQSLQRPPAPPLGQVTVEADLTLSLLPPSVACGPRCRVAGPRDSGW